MQNELNENEESEPNTPTTISETSDEECETCFQDYLPNLVYKADTNKRVDENLCMSGAKRLSAFI